MGWGGGGPEMEAGHKFAVLFEKNKGAVAPEKEGGREEGRKGESGRG